MQFPFSKDYISFGCEFKCSAALYACTWAHTNTSPHLLQGSTHSQGYIKQLNVAEAHCAVILPTVKNACNNGAYREARLDADVILTYQNLTAISPGLDIFMDINSGANLAFLIPQLKCKLGTTRELIDTPLVASGTVFLSGFLDSLFCQVRTSHGAQNVLELNVYWSWF